jgi:anti-sigma factor RsiW
MRCNELEGKLIEYLDGRARPAERRIAEAHLAECGSCRVRAEEFRALWSALDDLPALSPSPDFDASLRARIAAEPVHRGFWTWLPSPRLAFAMVALIAVSAWISSIPQVPLTQPAPIAAVVTESDFRMINDLPELENYDVLSKFDALSELPVPMDPVTPEPVTGKANE